MQADAGFFGGKHIGSWEIEVQVKADDLLAGLRGAGDELFGPAADNFLRRYSEGRQPIHLVKAFEKTKGLW